MRKEKEKNAPERVTRRSGTRVGGEMSTSGRDVRRSSRSYEERYVRDEREDRDVREERTERRVPEKQTKPAEHHAVSARSRHGGNPDRTVHQLVPYALFCLSIFAAVSFFLRDVAGLDGETGTFGSFLADFLCGLLGVAAYILPAFMFVMALRWRTFVKKSLLLPKILLSTGFLLLLSAIIHVFQDAARGTRITTPSDLYFNGVARVGGGFFGGFFGEYLGYIFRLPGTIILAIPLLLIIGIYLIGMTPVGLWERIVCKYRMMREKREARRAEMYDGEEAPAGKPKKEEAAPLVAEKAPKKQSALAVNEWREPRPLEHSAPIYRFREEEDAPIAPVRPPREEAARESTAPVREEPRPAATAAPAPERVLQETMEGVTSAPAAAPTPAAQVAEPTSAVASSFAAASATEPVQEPAPQPAYEGHVYAPFALPVQPFPERPQPAEGPAPTTAPSTASPFGDMNDKPTVAPFEDIPAAPVAKEEEELLGMFAPAPVFEEDPPAAVAAPFTPFVPEEAPREEVFSSPAEQPVSEREQESDVEEELASPVIPTPASPFTAFVPETASEEEPDDIADFTQEEQEELSYRPSNPFAAPREEQAASAFEEENASEEPADEPAPVETYTERVEPTFTPVVPPVAEPAPVQQSPVRPTPVPVHVAPVKVEPEPEPEPVIHEYVRPPLHLLNEDKNMRTDDFYEEIEETKDILRQTMASFNIKIQEQINYSHGPSVTRYEMRPVAGTSVRSVTNRTEDIALNLASSVRIEAPIPGKPAIGIEVPNKVRETVYMRTMLESDLFKNSTEPLEVPLGLDVGGAVRMCNLAKMPHLLVAGTTGSGKSVCINTILLSLIYKTSPEDLRLILIDPKQIEFAPYEDVPHLYMPIVTDMQRAAGALACAVQEMERRFSLIKDVGVRNIEAYNEAVKNDPEREHLPYIVIVIDEFNDLKMSCNNNDPENFTVRIAQKARAAGIHLIIGTQRPSVDVITGKLKGNIPSRIAFMVKQQVDSRTILDVNGAEALTGRGDMLYMATNASDKNPVRIQGAFVSDGELERVISFVRKNNDPVRYNKAFMDQIEVEMAKSAKQDHKNDDFDLGDEEGGEDPKFVEAVELAVQTQKVATSLLQRRLGVGYGRAAKIIDRMEELGLVSPAEGNKPRKLLPAAQGYLAHIGAAEPDDGEFEDDYS